MCTDEEAARRLHLEINGCSRRQRKGLQDQTRSARAGLSRKSKVDAPQAMDTEKSDNIGRPGKPLSGLQRCTTGCAWPGLQSLSDRFVGAGAGAGAGDTSNSLPDNGPKLERHASRSPSLQANPLSAGHTAVVVKVPSDHSCHVKAAALRDKAEKSSSTHCFYTKIPEPRKVSSPNLIDNRTKLAMFVNSMFSCEEIKCGQGSMLDVVFVPHDHGAASIRFPPLQPEQTCDGTAEERSSDGTTWSSASRNAAFVMLTQNEGTMQNMRHPKLVH